MEIVFLQSQGLDCLYDVIPSICDVIINENMEPVAKIIEENMSV